MNILLTIVWLLVAVIIAVVATFQAYDEFNDDDTQRVYAGVALASWTWPVTVPIALAVGFCVLVYHLARKVQGPIKVKDS